MTSASKLGFRSVLLATLTLAGIGLVAPAMAETATVVTFAPSSPWAQEVGSVDHFTFSHDYTVQGTAGNTLKINLISRNPNVFFKVKQQGERKPLIDTFKTGTSTWSTQVASAATYEIHVYVDPDATPRGETVKYALQIGNYGAQDMRPATTQVTFQPGHPWAQELGKVDSSATAHDYTVAIAAGNTLQVNLIAQNPGLHFKVSDANHSVLVDTGSSNATTWSLPVATAATYTIRVYVNAAAMPPGKAAGYALQVGQYPTDRTQPAGAASTATPATAAPGSSSTH